MIAALSTTVLFAMTPVFARRAAGMIGSTHANLARLLVAAVVLGVWAHALGMGFRGASLPWFVFGGILGFGVGGLAMFQSLPRLGSNLSTLIVQCGSAVVAVWAEWVWLQPALRGVELAYIGLTLTGIILGLMPQGLPRVGGRGWAAGVAWAGLSAVGQGLGAVVSRKAFAVAAEMQQRIDPASAAYQRAMGGLMVAAIAVAIVRWFGTERCGRLVPAGPWIAANALTGPILGVTCYQWALRTTPAAIVQPIVAAAPLLTIPFAAWVEGQRPRPLYFVGAVLAVSGVAGLMLTRR